MTLVDTSPPVHVAGTIELATFYVGDLLIGADIRQVEEINRQMDVTPLPHVPDFVVGVVNLRGSVVTIVDLAKVLHIDSNPSVRGTHNVIVSSDGERIGLAVDRIADVVHAPMDQIDELPANCTSIDARFLQGVYPMDEELLLILDVREALAVQSGT